MRIAIVGTHGSGKTTLIEEFVAGAPGYAHEPEPYYELLDAGAAFSDPPDADDFIAQLEFSIRRLQARATERDVIFDRCPLDLVAYLEVLAGADGEAVPAALMEAAEEAVRTLDLVAFLPLSNPDEIGGRPDYPKLRARVDRRLKEMLRGDEWQLFGGGGPPLVELRGPLPQRVAMLRRAAGL